MPETPGALGRRYLPFLALAAVQVLLVAIAPSKVPDATSVNANGGSGNNTNLAVGGAEQNGEPGVAVGQNANGDFVDAAGNIVAAPGGTRTTSGRVAAADMSKCDKAGRQIGVPGYKLMPPCVPVWHGGDNGGATMTGVTDKTINFVVYVAKGDATVNAILATQGLAASTEQSCEAKAAFYKEINKGYWESYGRKFVALDGSGANKGSTAQSPCNFPYFQGTCTLSPPDPPCIQAEAKVIASMHPAFVLGAGSTMSEELARQKVVSLGGGSAPRSYYQECTPYYYGLLMDGYRQADLDIEYWCKRMNAKPTSHAGSDVSTTRNWGAAPGQVPIRKLAALYPQTNGDPTTFLSVKRFKDGVTGGTCNTPGGVLMIPYQSDIGTAQQQSQTTVQQLIDNHITTVACFCDPIAPVFLTQNMSKQGYFPEHWIVGVGLIDYDVLGRLYDSTEWVHAFGVSDLSTGQPFERTDASLFWVDAGNSGTPDATENAVLPYFTLMATAFQVAGPRPTPDGIHKGLVALEPLGAWALLHDQHQIKVGFRAPSEWTATEDTREVNWSATRVSEIDGKPGSYCPIDGGHRYDLGEWLKGDPDVFDQGKNGC